MNDMPGLPLAARINYTLEREREEKAFLSLAFVFYDLLFRVDVDM